MRPFSLSLVVVATYSLLIAAGGLVGLVLSFVRDPGPWLALMRFQNAWQLPPHYPLVTLAILASGLTISRSTRRLRIAWAVVTPILGVVVGILLDPLAARLADVLRPQDAQEARALTAWVLFAIAVPCYVGVLVTLSAGAVALLRGHRWGRDAFLVLAPSAALVLAVAFRDALWDQDIPLTILLSAPYAVITFMATRRSINLALGGLTDWSSRGGWLVLAAAGFSVADLALWEAVASGTRNVAISNVLEQFLGSTMTLVFHFAPGLLLVSLTSGVRQARVT